MMKIFLRKSSPRKRGSIWRHEIPAYAGMTFLIVFLLVCATTFAAPSFEAQDESFDMSPLPSFCESLGYSSGVKCKESATVQPFHCDDIKPAPEYWGGLDPYLPMGLCYKYKGDMQEAVRLVGCASPAREQVLISIPNGPKQEMTMLKDDDEFTAYFAPISKPAEALSFVAAMTGSYPKYQFPEEYFIRDMNENGSYIVPKLLPTTVEEKNDGWHVRLFDHTRCGCNRPEVFEIEYVVTTEGKISVKNKRTIWQASRNYQICID